MVNADKYTFSKEETFILIGKLDKKVKELDKKVKEIEEKPLNLAFTKRIVALFSANSSGRAMARVDNNGVI